MSQSLHFEPLIMATQIVEEWEYLDETVFEEPMDQMPLMG